MCHWSGHNRWCLGKMLFSCRKRRRGTLFLACREHFCCILFFIILKENLVGFVKDTEPRSIFLSGGFSGCLWFSICNFFFALLFNRRRKGKYSLQHKILKCLYHNIIFVSANVKADRKFAALKFLLLLSWACFILSPGPCSSPAHRSHLTHSGCISSLVCDYLYSWQNDGSNVESNVTQKYSHRMTS